MGVSKRDSRSLGYSSDIPGCQVPIFLGSFHIVLIAAAAPPMRRKVRVFSAIGHSHHLQILTPDLQIHAQPWGSMSINSTYIGPKVYEYDLHWAIWSVRATRQPGLFASQFVSPGGTRLWIEGHWPLACQPLCRFEEQG